MDDPDDPTWPITLLRPNGRLTDHPLFHWSGSDDELVTMLRQMRRGRRLDIEGSALQRHGELGLWPPLAGQEGYQAGIAAVLRPQDMVFGTYREQSLALAMGVDPADMLALWRGSALCGWDPAARRLAPYSIIIGSHPLHAVGYAMGVARDKTRRPGAESNDAVTLALYGDGASSQGDVSEALVFAAANHAPVVFCCVNNQWAISEPTGVQTPVPLYQRAFGFGIPGIRVDGNDPIATRAVMAWAFDQVRGGHGPVLVEAFTYRMGPHTTSDDPTRYRSAELTERWRAQDPIDRLQKLLTDRGVIDDAWLAALDSELDEFGAGLRACCRALADTPIEEAFDTVLSEPGADLAEQRADCLDWLATPLTEGALR